MKDLENTWSHIMGRKLSQLREDRGMTLVELGKRCGVSHVFAGAVLARAKKGNEEFFINAGLALGMPRKEIENLIRSAMFDAMEEEYGAGFTFALKSKFKLSEKGVKDVLKFISDVQKMENE